MVEVKIQIEGMTCNSCVNRIENALENLVDSVKIDLSKEEAIVEYDEKKVSFKKLIDAIVDAGYSIKERNSKKDSEEKKEKLISYNRKTKSYVFNKSAINGQHIGYLIAFISIVVLLYFVYDLFQGMDLSIPSFGDEAGIVLLFLVGILTGFHCVSMCGGFVISYTTKNAMNGHNGIKQHFIYGGAKVISYAIIGGIFGLIGGIFAFSVGLRAGVSIFAGVFMIFYALGMLGIGFFKKFSFNPKFLTKATIGTSKKLKGFVSAPLLTGLLSGLFIACGPLQAMYLYAAGTGSLFTGFASLTAFGLGTLPVMFIFGGVASKISHKTTKKILKVAAVIVLILGIIMLNRGLTVIGSPLSFDAISGSFVNVPGENSLIKGDFQEINMEVTRRGWSPNSFVLKKGIPVRWNINVLELTGCNNEIIIREYGLDFKLEKGMNTFEFTPDSVGTVRWSCWMGMIPGSFVVTESGEASTNEIQAAAPTAGGSCGGGGGGCGCGGGR